MARRRFRMALLIFPLALSHAGKIVSP